ncbi:GNAT family N-acetyltransferase [Gallaecimonas mangrovi]|uniref:GNAT family N-acetyltransferase n=1 Tax=Gallaecimonas mangrovi TaxID=2291597 RepID=UPI00186874FE|nr:GNAT family protein [Gallaecimonas mangrovi]
MPPRFIDSFPPLRSQRLAISPLGEADLKAFSDYRARPEVARYQGWGTDYQLKDAEALYRQQLLLPFPSADTWYQLAIHNQQQQLVGDLALHWLDNQSCEVGFTLAPAHQGQGYATEALQCLLGYLFKLRAIKQVTALTDARNTPSAAVLARCGFKSRDKVAQKAFFKGQWCDEYHYQLSYAQWQANNSN